MRACKSSPRTVLVALIMTACAHVACTVPPSAEVRHVPVARADTRPSGITPTPRPEAPAPRPPPVVTGNEIVACRLVDETADTVWLDVTYRFTGDHPDEVAIRCYQAVDGKKSSHFAYQGARAEPGQHVGRVRLSTSGRAPLGFRSNQILIVMSASSGGGPLCTGLFDLAKVWGVLPRRVRHPRDLPHHEVLPPMLEPRLY